MELYKLAYIILVIFAQIMVVLGIIKNIKEAQNSIPDGKKFQKDFTDKVKLISEYKDIECTVLHRNFNVKVDIIKGIGLEYETIPMYVCHSVYINEEEVARVHIIHELSKDKLFLEFSSKRSIREVVEIINSAYEIADKKHSDSVAKMRSMFESKSFYEEEKE